MASAKEYSNREVTVVWRSNLCIHAAKCAAGLPRVFKPQEKPWIDANAASSVELMAQVNKCPSGALSYYKNGEKNTTKMSDETKIEVMPNGPLLVHGSCEVIHNGNSEKKVKVSAFCRCGASSNKPYCDGTHKTNGFVG